MLKCGFNILVSILTLRPDDFSHHKVRFNSKMHEFNQANATSNGMMRPENAVERTTYNTKQSINQVGVRIVNVCLPLRDHNLLMR